jgi:PAS domain S-box-containing protein
MKIFLKSIKLSLRLKLILLIEGFIVILVLVVGVIATMHEKETLENELHKRGLALASDLAKFMARPLLSNDLTMLRRFINHSMEQDYVRYVILLDPNGKVVMHSDLSEVGKTYKDALSIAALKSEELGGYTNVHSSEKEELHSDMFAQIQVSGVRLGTIRLGYSHIAVEKEIADARRKIFYLGILITITGGVFAYLFATFISSPIKRITNATRNVANGYLNTHLDIMRADEIGTLANTFNKMTEDLRRTTVSKNFFDNIIESMNDTLIVVGRDSKIKEVNKAMCELMGYRKEELIGSNINIIVSDDEKNFADEGFQRLVEEPNIINQEIDYQTKKGKRIPMLFSSATLKNKDGVIEGFVCIARDITERRRSEEALRQSEKELHFLSSQLMKAQEEERKRLSIELHDELGQALMVLKLKLSSIRDGLKTDQESLQAKCNEMVGYINEVTENVRRLSRDLSPSIMEDLGLSAAIRWLIETFTKHSNIESSVDMTEIDNLFSQDGKIAIYRIIQECLTNIAKHAHATSVSIVINKRDDNVLFSIEDNGKGFNMEEVCKKDSVKKGLGLSSIYERTRVLKGSLDIWSEEGIGTRVTFTIPISKGAV